MKSFLPISIDVANGKILIIGGGRSAYKRLKLLQRFGAEIEVLAIKVSAEIKQTGIRYIEGPYSKEHLNGYLMLYSCTNDYELDQQILIDGKAASVLVNIHDKPELCEFVSPAIYKDDNITVAVGSNAKDVFASIRVRDKIKAFLSQE